MCATLLVLCGAGLSDQQICSPVLLVWCILACDALFRDVYVCPTVTAYYPAHTS